MTGHQPTCFCDIHLNFSLSHSRLISLKVLMCMCVFKEYCLVCCLHINLFSIFCCFLEMSVKFVSFLIYVNIYDFDSSPLNIYRFTCSSVLRASFAFLPVLSVLFVLNAFGITRVTFMLIFGITLAFLCLELSLFSRQRSDRQCL